MNFKAALSKFLTNKLVLNIVSLLALFNVIGYMIMGYFNIVVLFIVIAILVRYFSKNMIVVLGIPLILINLISLRKNIYFEGFEGTDANKDETKNTIDKIKFSPQNRQQVQKRARGSKIVGWEIRPISGS